MKPFTTVAIAAALAVFACGLVGGLAAPARANDCETVLSDLNEAVGIATKNLETTMGELKKIMSEGADDKSKAKVKNMFCSASGEVLGTSRVTRAAAAECGPEQKAALASLDKSIKEMETAIDGTCK
jgi:hypothetical protein